MVSQTRPAQPSPAGGAVGRAMPATSFAAPTATRTITPEQVEAVRAVMRLFIEDDLKNGVAADRRMYCDGCEQPRSMAGFIQYDRHALCNDCATEYEVARLRGLTCSVGEFVRDKVFGDAELYLLPAAPSATHASEALSA